MAKKRFMGINPKHRGFCTPMTKSTCTPRRKALAKTLKKHHGFHKKETGGVVEAQGGTPPPFQKSGGKVYKSGGKLPKRTFKKKAY